MKIYMVSDTVKKGGGGKKSTTSASKRKGRRKRSKPQSIDEWAAGLPF